MRQWIESKAALVRRFRWFRVWLGLGALLAVLLVVNSVINYVFVSRRMVVDSLRRDMSRQIALLEKEVRDAGGPDQADLPALADDLAKDRKLGWIRLTDRDGNLLAQSGLDIGNTFSEARIRDAFTNHEPLFEVRDSPAGKVVVEVFRSRLGQTEIALPVEGVKSTFGPLQQNLIINLSAAVALLVAIGIIGLRFRAYVQGKQLEQQLEMARRVQRDLQPTSTLAMPGVGMAAECVPAWGVSGDFYDVFPSEDGGTAVVVGDVSGKGMPAALLMGVIHGAVQSCSWTESARRHEESSRKINRLLCERSSGSRFATMFWGHYDPVEGRLRYINAGHCPPLLVRRGGDVERLEDGGPVLGLLAGARYEQSTVRLNPGDLLVLYSDGVVEAASPAGEEFGEERLSAIAAAWAHAGVAVVRDEILRAVRDFAAGGKLSDDLTLVALEFQPATAGRPPERTAPSSREETTPAPPPLQPGFARLAEPLHPEECAVAPAGELRI